MTERWWTNMQIFLWTCKFQAWLEIKSIGSPKLGNILLWQLWRSGKGKCPGSHLETSFSIFLQNFPGKILCVITRKLAKPLHLGSLGPLPSHTEPRPWLQELPSVEALHEPVTSGGKMRSHQVQRERWLSTQRPTIRKQITDHPL